MKRSCSIIQHQLEGFQAPQWRRVLSAGVASYLLAAP